MHHEMLARAILEMRSVAAAHRRIRQFGRRYSDARMDDQGGCHSLALIVHHIDAEREYAHDRDTHFGKLDKALDAAKLNNWTVVSVKDDWKRIFKFQ